MDFGGKPALRQINEAETHDHELCVPIAKMEPSNRKSTLVVGWALCLAMVATSASAQFGGGMGGMHRGGADRSARKPDASNEANHPSLADRLYQLRIRLLVTPEQAPAWEHLYASFTALQDPMRRPVAMSDATSALQTMQQALSQAQDRYTLMETLADAMKQFYDQLNVEQRATADELMPALINDAARMRAGRDRAVD